MPTRSSRGTAADQGALAQKVYEGLRKEITSGKLRPGERLLRRRIAQRYGVSYTPVLEAMIRLELTGLIEAGHSQTARVRRMTLESIRSDQVLREAIEVQTVRLACESATEAEFQELYYLADIVDERVRILLSEGQSTNLAAAEWAFHRRVAELSRYPELVRQLERLNMLSHFGVVLYPPEQPAIEPSPGAHRLLVDIMKTRDLLAAENEMRAHLRVGRENQIAAFLRRAVDAGEE